MLVAASISNNRGNNMKQVAEQNMWGLEGRVTTGIVSNMVVNTWAVMSVFATMGSILMRFPIIPIWWHNML